MEYEFNISVEYLHVHCGVLRQTCLQYINQCDLNFWRGEPNCLSILCWCVGFLYEGWFPTCDILPLRRDIALVSHTWWGYSVNAKPSVKANSRCEFARWPTRKEVKGLKNFDKPWEPSSRNPKPGCILIMSKIITLDLRASINIR